MQRVLGAFQGFRRGTMGFQGDSRRVSDGFQKISEVVLKVFDVGFRRAVKRF